MFFLLLLVTLAIAAVVSLAVERLFRTSLRAILNRLVSDELGAAWHRYVRFAIYIVGISGGVRVWQLEKYIAGEDAEVGPVVLTGARWTLEVYQTVMGTLQSLAWMLLVFFLFALIAYVLVRGFELRRDRDRGPSEEPR